MYLKSIEVNGFKSFGKRSVLEFRTPISAIVGPNGSGKSNVAEAFRFVLGEQSFKNMRGKKGEDLIFNGAGGEARSNRAAVKIVFDNSQGIFSAEGREVDFSEVSIERVVHRDGTNEYSINGSKVRLKDVLELLASAKIGASGHHIISQGEADKVLNASPKDRKAFVEDALGLRLYQYKRQESERKLDKTFENIAQVEALRKEIAPHLRFLKKQVEKVEKAQSMRAELLALTKEYFKREEAYISSARLTISSEREPLQRSRETLSRELARAKKELEAVAEREKKDYVVLALESEISAARAHKDTLVRELGRIEGLISAEERLMAKERALLSSNESKTVLLRELEDFINGLEDERDAGEMRKKLSEFVRSRKAVVNTEAIAEAEKALNSLRHEKIALEEDMSQAIHKEKTLEEKYQALKVEIEKEKDSGRDAEKAVMRIHSEESEVLSKLKLLDAREEKIAVENAEFKRELEEVAHLVGAEVLEYKSMDIPQPLVEDRRAQEERKRDVQKLKIRLEDAGLSGSAEMLKEYQETSERDEFLARELEDLEKSADSLKNLIKDLEERLNTEFATGLDKINTSFTEMFETMFGGGGAQLTLTRDIAKKTKADKLLDSDPEDEFIVEESEDGSVDGLEISVSLPRKKIRSLMMLSGGERALTSIALIFAMSQVNPPPFIILDETDAALDESNSKKYGDIVEKLSKSSQLVLITHNRETMSRAGVIYGVTMSSTGVSKLLSIAFDEAVVVAK